MSASKFIYAVGRRKTATARVRLFLKKGPIVVNDKPIQEYFPGAVNKTLYMSPLKVVNKDKDFSATIKVLGSGTKAQIGAIVHGLARALAKYDPDSFRKQLKAQGFLTRDARTRERRKVGTGGKARRKKQSPKR